MYLSDIFQIDFSQILESELFGVESLWYLMKLASIHSHKKVKFKSYENKKVSFIWLTFGLF